MISLLVLISSLYQAQLTSTENYIYSKTCLTADCVKRTETVQYVDGLGRPQQSISVKAGGSQTIDLVTPVIYDNFGRQRLDVLPIPADSKNKGIHPDLNESSGSGFYGGRPFAEKILDDSPLNRVKQQIQPGADWQTHPSNFGYFTNSTSDVLKFSVTTQLSGDALYTDALTVNGYYASSKLYKNRVSDEDGGTSYEFKNTEGQTLLVRKVNGSEVNIAEQSANLAPKPVAQYLDTYYVYNEYNQLAFVISPLASSEFRANPNQTINNPRTSPNPILDNLCYQYVYDGRFRLVEKKIPGKGWESLVYDKADQLVMTQDSNLAAQGKWLISKYDRFGRVAYTGFIPGGSRQSMQGQASSYIIAEERNNTGFTMNGLTVYYTNNLFNQINTILSVNYYDTYPIETPFPANNNIQGAAIITGVSNTQGISTMTLPVATMVKNINDELWTKNYSFYDRKGRVIGTTSINHLGGSTRVEMLLDFAGLVQKKEIWHKKLAVESPVHIVENFTYDHQNRLKKHYHEVVGKTPKELLAENTYDDVGRLIEKKLGTVSDENFTSVSSALQTINYAYNIRGWMTGINLNTTGGLDTGKLFSYKIKYNDPVNTTIKKYNGNISEVDWTYGSNSGSRYEYTYDSVSRLRKGYFKTLNATTTTDSKYYNEELTYDVNGNIKTLKRNARPKTGTTANEVDDLTYEYENNNLSNRVSTIYDNAQNSNGYPSISIPQAMTYDSNGNIWTMPDKGITQNILYNYLNLPQTITKSGNPVTYTYRADGVKIHKLFQVNGQNIDTDYIDGFVYTTPYSPQIEIALRETPESEEMAAAGQLESFELAEKVVIKDPGGPVLQMQSKPNFFATAEGFYDYDNFRYIYQYKDHLGNARLNFGRDENGDLFKEDGNDYYPFGLNFINPPGLFAQLFNPSATYKNYKYNRKELQETGMYDYGWRQYMPDVGRWMQSDPLIKDLDFTFNPNEVDEDDDDEAENAMATILGNGGGIFNPDNLNPYSYGYNNPAKFDDPDGRCPLCIVLVLVGYGILDAPSRNVSANQTAKLAMTESRDKGIVRAMTGGTSSVLMGTIGDMNSDPTVRGGITPSRSGTTREVSKNKSMENLKKSSTIGQEAHRQIQRDIKKADPGAKIEKTVQLKDRTVRKDAIKSDGTAVIIKPNTASGQKSAKTRENLMKKNGYKTETIFYDPKNKAYQKGSPTYIGPKKKNKIGYYDDH